MTQKAAFCKKTRSVMVGMTLLAFAIFCHNSGTKSFWLDEGVTVARSSDWGEMWRFIFVQESAKYFLHYLPAYGLSQLNQGEFWIRQYSIAFATLTIPVIAHIGRFATGRNAGIIAGVIATLNVHFVNHAQEVRMYAMLVFFCALAMYFNLRASRSGRMSDWLGYCAATLLGTFTHLFALLTIACFSVATLVTPRKRPMLLPLAASGLVILAGLWLSTLATGLSGLTNTASVTTWIPMPRVRSLLSYAHYVSGHYVEWWFYIAYVGFFVLTIIATLKPARHDQLRTRIAVLFGFFGPPLITYFFSLWVLPVFVNRYLLSGLIPYSVIVTVCFVQARKHIVIGMAIAIYSIAPAMEIMRLYSQPREDWRSAAQFVAAGASPSDAILFAPSYAVDVFDAYARKYPELDRLVPISLDAVSAVSASTSATNTIWLVSSAYPGEPQTALAQAKLDARYTKIHEEAFNGISVAAYTQGATAP